jgi:hypothetical protein
VTRTRSPEAIIGDTLAGRLRALGTRGVLVTTYATSVMLMTPLASAHSVHASLFASGTTVSTKRKTATARPLSERPSTRPSGHSFS